MFDPTATPADREALTEVMCGYVSTILESCETCLPLFEGDQDPEELRTLGERISKLVSRNHLDIASSVVIDENCPERSFLIADAIQDLADYAQAALLNLKLGIRGITALAWKPRRLHLGLIAGDRSAAVRELVDERVELLMEDLEQI